mgnify:CR=1 FL=1
MHKENSFCKSLMFIVKKIGSLFVLFALCLFLSCSGENKSVKNSRDKSNKIISEMDSEENSKVTKEIESEKKSAFDETASQSKIKILATIFPIYDWVRELTNGSEFVEIELLLDNGSDLHSFTPSASDIIKISTADILIYVGGESDEWILSALKNKTNRNQIEINLMSLLGDFLKKEELVEGMQASSEDEDVNNDFEEDLEYDEHVWLSLRNAEIICQKISAELSTLLPKEKELFTKNLFTYQKKLQELDKDFSDFFNKTDSNTLIFCDRFPFRYFTEDYALSYYAAFLGCSAESEASFSTIAFLAKKIDELDSSKVFVIENSDKKIAQSVISSSKKKNSEIVILDSLQSTTKADILKGKTYISAMQENLDRLKN